MDNIQEVLIDIRERLVRVETKIDGYNGLREKLDKTYGMTLSNREDIEEMKDNRKWLTRTSIGALITSTVTLVIGAIVALIRF